mmetsp:Transcript_24901/g.81531  ORF Transcript_24901/g.81531 Transcript_24901/m.81531 type:complete len:225 (-) Transcript_24901:220-894(-)
MVVRAVDASLGVDLRFGGMRVLRPREHHERVGIVRRDPESARDRMELDVARAVHVVVGREHAQLPRLAELRHARLGRLRHWVGDRLRLRLWRELIEQELEPLDRVVVIYEGFARLLEREEAGGELHARCHHRRRLFLGLLWRCRVVALAAPVVVALVAVASVGVRVLRAIGGASGESGVEEVRRVVVLRRERVVRRVREDGTDRGHDSLLRRLPRRERGGLAQL